MDSVVHFEIPADNLKRAKGFYGKVFGWKMEKVPLGGEEFYFVTAVAKDKKGRPVKPGAINGDLSKRIRPGDPITIVVNASSIDRSLDKVKKSGGKVISSKQKIGDLGFYARIQDSEGNLVGLWQDRK